VLGAGEPILSPCVFAPKRENGVVLGASELEAGAGVKEVPKRVGFETGVAPWAVVDAGCRELKRGFAAGVLSCAGVDAGCVEPKLKGLAGVDGDAAAKLPKGLAGAAVVVGTKLCALDVSLPNKVDWGVPLVPNILLEGAVDEVLF